MLLTTPKELLDRCEPLCYMHRDLPMRSVLCTLYTSSNEPVARSFFHTIISFLFCRQSMSEGWAGPVTSRDR